MTATAEIAPTQNDNQAQDGLSQEENNLDLFKEVVGDTIDIADVTIGASGNLRSGIARTQEELGGSEKKGGLRTPISDIVDDDTRMALSELNDSNAHNRRKDNKNHIQEKGGAALRMRSHQPDVMPRNYDEDGRPVQVSGGLSEERVQELKARANSVARTKTQENNMKDDPGLHFGNDAYRARDVRKNQQEKDVDTSQLRAMNVGGNDGTVDESALAANARRAAKQTEEIEKTVKRPSDTHEADLSDADYHKIASDILEDAQSVDKDYTNNNSPKKESKEATNATAHAETTGEKSEEIWKSAQEKLAQKKETVRTAERAVVDMVQEIGQLREEIAQTEGSLADHEEKISTLIAKLDVARESFGNYGEETEMLRRKLDSLKENLQRLQVRVQAEKAPDAEAAAPSDVEMESFENAKQKARESGVQSFVFNGETYTRVGSRYILNPQVDSGEEVVAAESDHEEPATENKIEDYKKKFMAQVEGAQEQEGKQKEVQEEAQENEQEGRILPEQLRAELAVAREAFAQAKLNGAQESVALQERYKSVREAYLQMYREDPQLYAQMAAREMERLIAAMRAAAGSDTRKQKIVERFRHDALVDPTIRRAFGVGKQVAELRDVQAFVDEATVNGRPNTEQFILEDGENLSEAERAAKALAVLEGAVDEKFERLAATDLEKKYGGLLGRRLVQRVFEGIKRMKQTRADVRAAREAHEQWEKNTYDERKEKAGTSEPSYLMGGRNKAREEVLAAREAHEQWEKERLEQRHKNDHSTDDVNIPELTEVVNHPEIEREAVKKIAQILKEEHLAIDLFENVNVSDFATDSTFDRNARQFALTYVNDAIEEFGDEVNPQKNATLKDMTLKDYLKFVEEKRLPIKGKV